MEEKTYTFTILIKSPKIPEISMLAASETTCGLASPSEVKQLNKVFSTCVPSIKFLISSIKRFHFVINPSIYHYYQKSILNCRSAISLRHKQINY